MTQAGKWGKVWELGVPGSRTQFVLPLEVTELELIRRCGRGPRGVRLAEVEVPARSNNRGGHLNQEVRDSRPNVCRRVGEGRIRAKTEVVLILRHRDHRSDGPLSNLLDSGVGGN